MQTAAVLATMLAAGAFALVTDAHGVKVSMKNDVRDIQLVADGTFDAPPEKVLRAMIDYEKAPTWQKQLAESKILSRDAHSLIVYQKLKLPIISDRDYTLHVTWGDDDKGSWMKFRAGDGGPPSPKGVVRTPIHQGAWRLDKSADGQGTVAHYEVEMDLGGSLPASMARKNVAKSIPDFFEGLRGQLK